MAPSLWWVLACASQDPRVELRSGAEVVPSVARVVPPPVSGGGLAQVGTALLVADPDADRLFAVDLESALVTGSLSLTSGDHPGRIASDDVGGAFVVLRGAGQVLAVTTAPLAVRWRVDVCTAPRGVAWDPSSQLVRVVCASGDLVTIDPLGSVVGRVRLEPDLRDVVVEEDRIWVSVFRDAAVIRVAPDGEILDRKRPSNQLFTQAVDTGTQSPGTLFRAAVAWGMHATPGGGVTLLHQWRSMAALTVGGGEHEAPEPGAYGGGGCDTVVLGGLTEFSDDAEPLSGSGLAGVALAVDLTPSPDGWDVAVTSGGVASAPADFSPEPTCGNVPSVLGSSAPTVAVLRDASGRLWALSRQPTVLQVEGAHVSLPDTAIETDPAFALFHRDVGGGLACASCHPEAGDDGQVWSFDVGERRTQTLRASVGATAPYHWDGEFPTLVELMDEVMVGRMSGEPATAPEIARLQQWLDALPPVRTAEPSDPSVIARGAEAFFAAECATCHQGPALTDNEPHDVGTGGSFQTPSLLGIGSRAPYLHDGCAATLAERFGPCGGDAHGLPVPASELDAIVAFLETL